MIRFSDSGNGNPVWKGPALYEFVDSIVGLMLGNVAYISSTVRPKRSMMAIASYQQSCCTSGVHVEGILSPLSGS